MKSNYRTAFFLVLIALLISKANAQNIRGDTIFLQVNKVVTVDLPTAIKSFQLLRTNDGQEGLYEINTLGPKSISILALKHGAEEQYLEVNEKDRKHLFILTYKDGSPARKVDYSTKRKANERAKETETNLFDALSVADSLYDRAKINPTDHSLWKVVETRYERLVKVVDEEGSKYIKTRLEEIRKQDQDFTDSKYSEAIKEGQNSKNSKNYSGARKAYLRALDAKPGDLLAQKSLDLIDSLWSKDISDQGDDASKGKKYILAKSLYKQALSIKPDNLSLLQKFTDVRKYADPLIYNIEKENGNLNLVAGNFKEARAAYDSALAVKAEDKFIKNQLKAVQIEEERVATEDKKDAAYQEVLARAKSLAEKASNEQEYDLAIKEFKQASTLIPNRNFPIKRIAELTKKKRALGKVK